MTTLSKNLGKMNFNYIQTNIMCDHYVENHSSINSKSKSLLLNQSEGVFANSNIQQSTFNDSSWEWII